MIKFPEEWPPNYLAVIQNGVAEDPFLRPSVLNESQEVFAKRIAELLVPQVFRTGDRLITVLNGHDGTVDPPVTELTVKAVDYLKNGTYAYFNTSPPTPYDIEGNLRPQRYVDTAEFY